MFTLKMKNDFQMNGDETEAPIRSDPCPICLGHVKQEAYLDECFHVFCYKCIVQWMTIVNEKSPCGGLTLKCPMCKRANSCIIHSYDGRTFEKHYVNGHREERSFFSSSHKYRLQCYYSPPGNMEDVFDVPRYWKFRKYSQPNRWLEGWVTREIQALLQEADVQIIVHHIMGVIESFIKSKKQKVGVASSTQHNERNEFETLVCGAARPFLMGRTDRFIQELELYLASHLNIQAYDEVYMQHTSQQTVPSNDRCTEEHTPVLMSSLPSLHIFEEDYDDLE